MKDTLFLLKPGFLDGPDRFFCAGCATVEGMLSFYPKLREAIDVVYVGYARPRAEIVREVGEAHQSAPCLVVRNPENRKRAPMSVQFTETPNGKLVVNEPVEICEYLAATYGTDRPH